MLLNNSEITKEMLEKAMQCKTVEELMELTKSKGIDITKDEAEAYLAELSDYELKEGELKDVAGGSMQGPPTHKTSIDICYMVSLCRKDM
jgi:hypothetical protein